MTDGEKKPFIDRVDPSTRILALALATTPLLLSIDWLSASVSLALTLFILAPVCGYTPLSLLRRGWPLLLIAPISGLSMLLYGRAGGEVYWSWSVLAITDNSLRLALGIMIRVLAVGLPAIVLLSRIDPTRLGDGLAQIWRLPPRFVLGAVAGVRLVSLFRQDWYALERAQRARGRGDHGRLRRFPTQVFGLLVLALRRGAKLSTAMDARGYRLAAQRTWGRPARWSRWDTLLALGSAIAPVIALGVAWYAGTLSLMGVG